LPALNPDNRAIDKASARDCARALTPSRQVLALLGFAVVICTACASYTTVPQEERLNLERDLTGKRRDKFLRLSFYVTPFFGDASKKLLTAVPPEEVRLLEQPGGEPINPGPVERVLPAGARVRITKVEFPTSWAVAERLIYTPRTQPWIYLQAEGRSDDLPLILVLRPQIRSSQEFVAEIERYLSDADLTPTLSRWSDVVQKGVRTKTAMIDMPAEALEMAWGYPEKKQISFADAVKNEEWTYPGERRRAYLADGRVVQLESGKAER
jgi:hypothetical protein